jgi:gluconolactonase
MMKFKGILASFALLGMTMIVSAEAPAPSKRHNLSDICAGDSCQWEKVAKCEGFIEGINFDSEGTLWLLAYLKGEILTVQNGKCVAVGEASGAPNGAKIGPDGNLIIADRTGGIQSVNLKTGERTTRFSTFGVAQFRGLNDLSFAKNGGMYFTEPYGSDAINKVGRVYYVAPEKDAKPELFYEGLAFPNGVAVSADGQRVYVSEFAENRVISLPSKSTKNPFDTPFVFARMEGGVGPDGLTVDADGNLYAAHFFAGEIVIFDALGFPYGNIRLPVGSGLWTTNLALHDGYLYVTEAMQNIVWRLPVKTAPLIIGQ